MQNAAMLEQGLAIWAAGIQEEIAYWRGWLRTKGDEWPDDYADRLTERRPIGRDIAALLTELDRQPRILDVGAGPISICGTELNGKSVELVAVDPLATAYDEILTEEGIVPPVRTRFAFAEDLSTRFEEGYFDVVFSRNALDHTIDPLRGLLEMLIVLKLGGRILLSHRRNEGKDADYEGLHQWNFDDENGEFVIWNEAMKSNVSQELSVCAAVKLRKSREPWIRVVITKLSNPVDNLMEYHRLHRRACLDAFVEYLLSGAARPQRGRSA